MDKIRNLHARTVQRKRWVRCTIKTPSKIFEVAIKRGTARQSVKTTCENTLNDFVSRYSHDWRARLQTVAITVPSYEGIKMMIFDAHIDVKILQKLYPEEFAADPAFALD